MRKITSLFAMAVLLLCMAACERETITPDNGLMPEYKVTATIEDPNATRVEYTVDNTENTIAPKWKENDSIFGFDDQGNTFTYKVASVDPGTGEATMALVGDYDSGTATKAYAIYYPGKEVTDLDGSGADQTLAVDLSSQTGVLSTSSPVLMCATADITAGGIDFTFRSQVAIVGVKAFQLPEAATITSMELVGVVTSGSIAVVGGELKLTPSTTTSRIKATGSWVTADDGGCQKCKAGVYFASLPTTSANLILDASSDTKTYANVTALPPTLLEAGNYYYMSKILDERVAAVGTTTYSTIGEAWAAANVATEKVKVTLLKDCSAAATLELNSSGTGDVVFDLNGKTITGPASGYTVSVRNGRTLRIEDSSSDNYDAQGKIVGVSNNATVYVADIVGDKSSEVSLCGGSIIGPASNEKYPLYLSTSSKATITGGRVMSSNYRGVYVCGSADLTISGGEFDCKNFCVYNYNTVTITNGVFKAKETAVVTSNGSTNGNKTLVAITGGYYLRENEGELFTISNSAKCYVAEAYTDRPVNNSRAYTVDGKSARSNTLNGDAATKATYPYKVGNYNKYYYTKIPSYNYNHASFSCAARHANTVNSDVTVEMRTDLNNVAAVSLSNPAHTVTLDLKGHKMATTAASLLSTTNHLVITSSEAGGIISSTKNNVISVTVDTAIVEISDCTITSSCAQGSDRYSVRTIYHTDGTVSLDSVTVISENSTAIYTKDGAMSITASTITSKHYGLFATGTADATLAGDANSIYSEYRAVFSNNKNAKIAIEGGYYYATSGNNALSATSAEAGLSSFTFTGGFFSSIHNNLSGSEGRSNIKPLDPAVTHTHDADHENLSYGYGYVTPTP